MNWLISCIAKLIKLFRFFTSYTSALLLFALSTVVLSSSSLLAQNMTCEWAHLLGGKTPTTYWLNTVAIDNNGFVYVAGAFEDSFDFNPGTGSAVLYSNGGEDMYIAKYSESGNYEWAISMGGSGGLDGITDIALDKRGNVYVTGSFQDSVDMDPSNSSSSILSVKPSYGPYQNEGIFIAKYNQHGMHVWSHGFDGFDPSSLDKDIGTSLAVDNDCNVYLTGEFEDTIDFDPAPNTTAFHRAIEGGEDIFLVKFDSSGSHIWSHSFSNPYRNKVSTIVCDTGRNRIYIGGSFSDTIDFDPSPGQTVLIPSLKADIFLASYDFSGKNQWAISLATVWAYNAGIYDITLDQSGNLLVTGAFKDSIDFNPGPLRDVRIATPTGNGAFIYPDMFVAKYDKYGNLLWANSMGGKDQDIGEGIAVDKLNNIYVTGQFRKKMDFDPHTGIAELITNGIIDIFLAKYDENGNYINAFNVGSNLDTWQDIGHSIVIDTAGIASSLYLAGVFEGVGPVDFEPDPSKMVSVTGVNVGAQAQNNFLAKYSPCTPVTGPPATAGICPEDTLYYGNRVITGEGKYEVRFQGAECDSIVELTVTEEPAHTESSTASICAGETYEFDTMSLTTAGNYSLVYENQYGCDSVVTLILTVNQIDTSVYQTNNTLNSNAANATYQWVNCDGYEPIAGATNQSFTPSINGTYAVILNTPDGCSDTSACYNITGVGMEEIKGVQSINVYPNPASGNVFLELETEQRMSLEVEVQDGTGKMVYTRSLAEVHGSNTYELPMEQLAAGAYHVVLRTDEGQVVRKVVVVE